MSTFASKFAHVKVVDLYEIHRRYHTKQGRQFYKQGKETIANTILKAIKDVKFNKLDEAVSTKTCRDRKTQAPTLTLQPNQDQSNLINITPLSNLNSWITDLSKMVDKRYTATVSEHLSRF